MSGEPTLTVVGNVAADPELRFTPSGDAVASFNIGNTPRVQQKDGTWVDQETTWYRVSAWRKDAEGVAEVIRKGNKVRVTGRLKPGIYEAKDGTSRLSMDLTADMDGIGVIPKAPKRLTQSGGEDPWS